MSADIALTTQWSFCFPHSAVHACRSADGPQPASKPSAPSTKNAASPRQLTNEYMGAAYDSESLPNSEEVAGNGNTRFARFCCNPSGWHLNRYRRTIYISDSIIGQAAHERMQPGHAWGPSAEPWQKDVAQFDPKDCFPPFTGDGADITTALLPPGEILTGCDNRSLGAIESCLPLVTAATRNCLSLGSCARVKYDGILASARFWWCSGCCAFRSCGLRLWAH